MCQTEINECDPSNEGKLEIFKFSIPKTLQIPASTEVSAWTWWVTTIAPARLATRGETARSTSMRKERSQSLIFQQEYQFN